MARKQQKENSSQLNSKALFLTPDNDERAQDLSKVLANLFEFYANSGSIVKDRKNRIRKTGRPISFCWNISIRKKRGLELGQQKQKK